MRIKLTKDLSPLKGRIRGIEFDWPASTVHELSRQLAKRGIRDWYVVLSDQGLDPRELVGGNRADLAGEPVADSSL